MPVPSAIWSMIPPTAEPTLLRDDGGVPLQGVDHGRVLVDVVEGQRHQQDARPGGGWQVVP
jgi:hypothetical protein